DLFSTWANGGCRTRPTSRLLGRGAPSTGGLPPTRLTCSRPVRSRARRRCGPTRWGYADPSTPGGTRLASACVAVYGAALASTTAVTRRWGDLANVRRRGA